MALDLLNTKGTPLDKQKFTWRDLVRKPVSKLNVDAFTRIRIIIMNGIEFESVMFSHNLARINRPLREPLALIRNIEQHQQTLINWLLPADMSAIETTIAYEQVAIEVTASVAQNEPDEYMAQNYRFGLLEDFDHLYRYSALLDRLEGKDANNILQSYTDILPGRPTIDEHRYPLDNLRTPYSDTAQFVTKMNALAVMSAEQQTLNYYMNIGPTFADPVARQLYAEIASIEEQHVSQYESLLNPAESLLERWLLHEANEVYTYWSCVESEDDPAVKAVWERFLDYELGHLNMVTELFKSIEGRDPAEVLPAKLPKPVAFKSQRDFVRRVLSSEVDLRSKGSMFVSAADESEESKQYRKQMNLEGSPSESVAQGYHWIPGGEIVSHLGIMQTPKEGATI